MKSACNPTATPAHALPVPMPSLSEWSRALQEIASRPLTFCEGFPAIARRFEAWWEHQCLDRPIFIASANPNPSRPITRRIELIEQPDAWFAAKLADMRQLHRVGDALPLVRLDFGPVLLGGMLGGRIEFGADTTWTHPMINDDWSNAPDWVLRENNRWWKLLRQLAERVAKDAAGRYLMCTPDLGGSADVLLNLRGSQTLCMDAIEQPERVRAAIAAIYPAWHQAFTELYRIALAHHAGICHWLNLWSNRPYMIPACDFNFMIGPSEFQELCLPDIARQAATVGRAVFHLDGPGAARHIDALLEVPEIQAIQFTPGEGSPSALAWVKMFRKIQKKGRSLLVICPSCEVLSVCETLRPEGLAVMITDSLLPKALDDLFEAFTRQKTGR
ncbi:MAG: hypothetical protein HY360_19040 [Verrucomicrobia bacterium]|nr:hypothetical protein [Verrucomicrobiota bacterium]